MHHIINRRRSQFWTAISKSTNHETINVVRCVIRANRRLPVQKVADEIGICVGLCYTILTKRIDMHCFAAKLVPLLLRLPNIITGFSNIAQNLVLLICTAATQTTLVFKVSQLIRCYKKRFVAEGCRQVLLFRKFYQCNGSYFFEQAI